MKDKLMQIAQKLSDACGFKIIRKKRTKNQGQLRKSMGEALAHLSKLKFEPETVIDVGVAYGTHELYNEFPNAKLILIEPLEEYEPTLKKICEKYTAEYMLSAAGPKKGKILINVHPDLSGSSILCETEGRHVDGIMREVNMDTIDNICKKLNLKGPYLIKIDVQGAELEVLEGAMNIITDTEAIILEASLFQFFKNGPQFYDIINYMKDRGYCVYDIFGGNFRPFDDALGQVDLVFVKENGRFRNCHYWATKEQRLKITDQRIQSLNPE